MSYIVLLTLSLLSFMISCGGKSVNTTPSEKKTVTEMVAEKAPDLIRMTEPSLNDEFKAGSGIRIRFEHKSKTIPDSVEIYFAGALFRTFSAGELEATIPSGYTKTTGKRSIKLMAYAGGRRPQSITIFVTVISDLIPKRYSYRVEKVFPHDEDAYTQGFLYHDGFFYEGTGLEGKSSLRKVDTETGRVVRRHDIDSRFFGEGITIHDNLIYQLTWKTRVGFVYDIETFNEVGKFYYNSEGWGLTTMNNSLVMSDGTNKLYFMEPTGFTLQKTLEVYDNKSLVTYLNELEYINGEIWANIYMSDLIARVDPETGRVLGYIDLAGLIPENERRNDGDDVLNGIAWDSENGRVFVTGKNWPRLFQIRITE